MQITITGCNKCPFRNPTTATLKICVLDWNISNSDVVIDTNNGYNQHKFETPHNCPITLNGGTITVTTKSE